MAEACILCPYTLSTIFQVCFPPSIIVDPVFLLEYLLEIFLEEEIQFLFHSLFSSKSPGGPICHSTYLSFFSLISRGKVGIFMIMSDEKGIKWKRSCNMDHEERSADSGACSKGFLQLTEELNSLQNNFALRPAVSLKTLACLWYIAFCINVFKIYPFLKLLVFFEILSFNCLKTALFASCCFSLMVCLNAF